MGRREDIEEEVGGVNRNKGGLSKSTSFNYVLQTRKKKKIIKTQLKHFRKKMR